jgi:superfamily II DNA or RNA helicase
MLPPGSGKSTIGALLSLTAQQLFCVDATVLVVPPNLVDTWMDEIRACIASDDRFAFHAVILDKQRILCDHHAYTRQLVMAARGLYDTDDRQYTTFFLLKTSLLNEDPLSQEARALVVFMRNLTTQLATLVIADETHLSFRAPDSTPARNWRLMFDGTGHPNPPLMLGMSATPVLNKEREFKTMLELLGVRLPPGLNLQDLKTTEARDLLESVTIAAQVTAYKPYDNVRPHATVLMRVNRVEDDARPKYTEALKQTIGLLVDGEVSLSRLPKLRAAADIAQHVVEDTGENVCVFVDYVQALHALKAELEDRGLHVVQIHGGIPLEQRRRSIEEALASPYGGTVFLGTSQAMGTGLNLHRRCRVAITVSSQWSLKLQEQLDGRLRRIRDPGDTVTMTTSIILQGDANEEEDVFRAAHAKLERMAMPSEGEFEDDPPDLQDLLPCPPEMVRETAAAILAFHSGTGKAICQTPYTRLDRRLSRCPHKACLADAAQTPAIGDEASRVLQALQALATGG